MKSYADYLLDTIRQPAVSIACIIIITLLSYANVFSNGFAWDDKDTIMRWEATRTWQSVPAMILGATPPGHPGNYRPVRNILYILSYHLWGINPWGYHLQTALLAVGTALLVFGITSLLVPNTFVPLVTALLFGTHPIHVEALTWMTSMMDMFGMFFGLGSVYLFLVWRKQMGKWWWYAGSFILCFLAIFSNEITLSVPLLVGLILFLFPKANQRAILTLLPYISIIAFNICIRTSLLHIGARFTYVGNTFTKTILVMLQAMLTYWRLLIVPTNLTINHNLGNGLSSWAIELIDPESIGYKAVAALTPTTSSVMLSALIIGMLILSAWFSRKKYPLYSFCVGWFFISMVPVSNLIPTEAILTERFAFLSSFGYCLLVATLVNSWANLKTVYTTKSRVGWMVIACMIFLYMGMTIQRNAEWQNDQTLYESATQRNHQAFIAHISLANYYYARGDLERALQAYLTANEINPKPEDVRLYIAATYHALGKNNESIIYLSRILKNNPWNIEAYFRLGNLYKDTQRYDLAIATYRTALKVAPNYTPILNNLGVIYSMQGNRAEAKKAFQTALSYDPTYENAQLNLEKINTGDTNGATEFSNPPITIDK